MRSPQPSCNSIGAFLRFWTRHNLAALAAMLLVVFVVRWSICAPYFVPTGSMLPTILVGDRVLLNRTAYQIWLPFTQWSLGSMGPVQRGDIIVFQSPQDPSVDYVKRVVGLSGDRIALRNGDLYINDVRQRRITADDERDSVAEDITTPDFHLFQEDLNGVIHATMDAGPSDAMKNWPPREIYTVPAGTVFVLGDNRDQSMDSRAWGAVPLSYIRGKVLFVLWSLRTKKDSWIPGVRFLRTGLWLD